jgi:3'-phosphoadenosine 5'-phosphosulfate sulfotransferase (PAPS reductase)/FAD synthetase
MTCNKIRFPSRPVAESYRRTIKGHPRKLYVYECPRCGCWHLTSQQQRQRRRAERRARRKEARD